MDPMDIQHRFAYHAPKNDEKRRAHERVRSYLGQVAEEFNQSLPEGREKSLAVTKLEEAMFWANAALAREKSA